MDGVDGRGGGGGGRGDWMRGGRRARSGVLDRCLGGTGGCCGGGVDEVRGGCDCGVDEVYERKEEYMSVWGAGEEMVGSHVVEEK